MSARPWRLGSRFERRATSKYEPGCASCRSLSRECGSCHMLAVILADRRAAFENPSTGAGEWSTSVDVYRPPEQAPRMRTRRMPLPRDFERDRLFVLMRPEAL